MSRMPKMNNWEPLRARMSTQEADGLGRLPIAMGVLGIIAVVRLWVLPLHNSFWLDESLIAWIVRNGFAQITPAASADLQSIGFCWLEWAFSGLFGPSEIALRLPSLLAAIGSLYIYYRLGTEFIDRETGIIFAAFFLSLPQVALETPNARPYSVGLLAEASALLWLQRWLRTTRLR